MENNKKIYTGEFERFEFKEEISNGKGKIVAIIKRVTDGINNYGTKILNIEDITHPEQLVSGYRIQWQGYCSLEYDQRIIAPTDIIVFEPLKTKKIKNNYITK